MFISDTQLRHANVLKSGNIGTYQKRLETKGFMDSSELAFAVCSTEREAGRDSPGRDSGAVKHMAGHCV